MRHHQHTSTRHLTIRVTRRDDPVSEVVEQDALRAAERYPGVVVRGPVFGFAAQRPADGERWRLLSDMSDGFPQHSRDGLTCHLSSRAAAAGGDGPLRARLLAAVARLEREPLDELRVGDTRYRVVRGDEFARVGPAGIEGPRPTDPDDPGPAFGEPGRTAPCRTTGFVVDHARATGVAESLQRMELLALRYRATRFPPERRADSRRAMLSHPGVVLLPAAFTFAERRRGSWEPLATPQPTPQDARRTLVSYLAEFLPELEPARGGRAERYLRAAREYRAGPRRDEVRVLGRRFRIIRVQRMMRVGPDGPEPPRPSDRDPYGPLRAPDAVGAVGAVGVAEGAGRAGGNERRGRTEETRETRDTGERGGPREPGKAGGTTGAGGTRGAREASSDPGATGEPGTRARKPPAAGPTGVA